MVLSSSPQRSAVRMMIVLLMMVNNNTVFDGCSTVVAQADWNGWEGMDFWVR